MAEFGKVTKRATSTGKRIKKKRSETHANVRGLGKFKAKYFESADDMFNNLLYK